MRTPPGSSRAIWADAAIAASMVAAGLLSALGAAELRNEILLRRVGVAAEARVTETRIGYAKGRGRTFEVRYELTAGGRAHTRRDALGRSDLWSTVPVDEWEAARRAGAIRVVLLRERPWISRPARTASAPVLDALAVLAVCTGWIALGAVALRRRRRAA